jgi:F-type H+-transporting ATPase subunit b
VKRLVPVTVLAAMSALPASAAGGGGSYFGIPDQVWLFLNLALFLFLLYRFVGRPISQFLDSRRDSIARELEEARRKIDEAEQLRAQVVARLEQVEGEINELKERAEREGRAEAARIEEQAAEEEQRFLSRVEDEISRRQQETRTILARETAALTTQLAKELLDREITDADRQRVLERSLAAMHDLSGGK